MAPGTWRAAGRTGRGDAARVHGRAGGQGRLRRGPTARGRVGGAPLHALGPERRGGDAPAARRSKFTVGAGGGVPRARAAAGPRAPPGRRPNSIAARPRVFWGKGWRRRWAPAGVSPGMSAAASCRGGAARAVKAPRPPRDALVRSLSLSLTCWKPPRSVLDTGPPGARAPPKPRGPASGKPASHESRRGVTSAFAEQVGGGKAARGATRAGASGAGRAGRRATADCSGARVRGWTCA
jgi:hypothetical protein